MALAIFPQQKVTNRSAGNAFPIDVAIVDSSGAQISTFGGSGGTAQADQSAFTVGAGLATPVQGLYELAPTTVPDGEVGVVGMTTDRKLKVSGSFSASPITASTNALTSVAENAASVTVLAANANRLAFTLYNGSNAPCYIKFGATASASSFLKRMLPGELLTTQHVGVNYTGRIDAIWDSTPATGAAAMLVNEMTV